MPADDVRAITFCTLVVANLGLVFVNRSCDGHGAPRWRERTGIGAVEVPLSAA